MKIQIEFNCDNATFIGNPDEIKHLMRYATEQVLSAMAELDSEESDEPQCSAHRLLKDSNGNSIGHVWALTYFGY